MPDRFSGKKIVLIIALTAAAAWTFLLFTGLKEKHRRLDAAGKPRPEASDSLSPSD